MMSYSWVNADVPVKEMKKSDSKDKYVHSHCERVTEYLSLESEKTSSEDIAENSSDNSFDDLFENIQSDLPSNVLSDDSRSPIRKKIRK